MRLPGFVLQIAFLTLTGSALGLSVNALSKRGVPLGQPVYANAQISDGACHTGGAQGPGYTSVPDAAALCAACAAGFVDARGAAAYAAGHIAGAIHLPPAGHASEGDALSSLSRFPAVIVYDDGTDAACSLAQEVAARLSANGMKSVQVLRGGYVAWEAAQAPAESGTCGACEAALPTAASALAQPQRGSP